MHRIQVFTDGSVNTQRKIGYGAYFIVSAQNTCIDTLKDSVKIKRFENTSSTKLELQTLLWSLEEVISLNSQSDLVVTIYTDSQNIIGLPNRQATLEKNNYLSKKNKQLDNHELYREFYRVLSFLKHKLVKVVGHKKLSEKDDIDKLFSLVDKASRRALREEFNGGL
jgi:ribonuclease HI